MIIFLIYIQCLKIKRISISLFEYTSKISFQTQKNILPWKKKLYLGLHRELN